MKLKSSPNSYEAYLDKYGFSNITELEFASELGRYRNLGKDQKTIEFIAKFLLKYGIHNPHKQWTFENTQYVNSYTKIEFTCKKHGIKSHLPYKMLNDRVSQGCGECGIESKTRPSDDVVKNSMKIMSTAKMEKTVEKLFREYGFSNISESDYMAEIAHYDSIDMSKQSKLLICQRLLKYGKPENLIFDSVNYLSMNKPITVICKKHGAYEQIAGNFVRGYGCFKCIADGQKVPYDDVKKDPRYEYDDEWNKKHWKGVSGSIIRYKCKVHGIIEQKSIVHFLSNHGCPFCSESHMEKQLHNKLVQIGLEYGKDFTREKEFPGLVGDFNTPLRYDFFFSEKKLLIELDGEFHYDQLYCTEEDFERRIKYDKTKNEYAKKNGFKLVRIRYNEFDKWINGIKSINDI